MTASSTTTRSVSSKSNGGTSTAISRTRNGKTTMTMVRKTSFHGNGGKTSNTTRVTNTTPKPLKVLD